MAGRPRRVNGEGSSPSAQMAAGGPLLRLNQRGHPEAHHVYGRTRQEAADKIARPRKATAGHPSSRTGPEAR